MQFKIEKHDLEAMENLYRFLDYLQMWMPAGDPASHILLEDVKTLCSKFGLYILMQASSTDPLLREFERIFKRKEL